MSKYLKPATAERYSGSGKLRDSAYASSPRVHPTSPQRQSPLPITESVQVPHQQTGHQQARHQETGVSIGTTEYTGSDHQQFDELSEFPALNVRYNRNAQRIWASCQFTEQDNTGFQHLMQNLSTVAELSR